MKKIKDFTKYELVLIFMLIISIIMVVLGWNRISFKAKQVFDLYMGKPPVETKK